MSKYAAILADLERKLADERVRPGQKLPSVRSAASDYGCSVGTVVRAYAELEKRHAIYSIPQSGYYAVDRPGGRPIDRSGPEIDFASALPDPDVFPYLDFQHCLNKAIDTYKQQLFAYGDPWGMDNLRTALASQLTGDGLFVPPERIAITAGAQQALEILAKMPFPNGKRKVLVEQPGYNHYLRYLEAEGIPVCGIARSNAGIDLNELEDRFRSGDVKFFYTMPRHHNPLGTTYSAAERQAIAELAERYDVYVAEDDYMADLGDGRGYEPIGAHGRSARVAYVKSFSKIVFPGLRLGAVVLPESLREAFRACKPYADASLLSQAALEVYIKSGMYERHRRAMRSEYAARMRTLREAVRRHEGNGLVEVSDVRTGIYMALKLPRTANAERLTERLASRGVAVASGKSFYLADWPGREKLLRIGISRVREERIDEGVKAIFEEIARSGRH